MIEIRQLVILAGGKGSRLKHETYDTPKPLVTLFDDKCILGLLIDKYLPQFSEILILAGFQSDKIVKFIAKNYETENIRVLCEVSPSGTAGALFVHRHALKSKFTVINGDTWFDSDLEITSLNLVTHLAGIILTNVDDPSRYGSVHAAPTGEIIGFSEKSNLRQEKSGLINAGVYVFSKHMLAYISTLPCSLERDIFPQLAKEKLLTSWITSGQFLDIGIPETLTFARTNQGFFVNEI